jgi:hypothetical protein
MKNTKITLNKELLKETVKCLYNLTVRTIFIDYSSRLDGSVIGFVVEESNQIYHMDIFDCKISQGRV